MSRTPASRPEVHSEIGQEAEVIHLHTHGSAQVSEPLVATWPSSLPKGMVVLDICEQALAPDVRFRAQGSTAVVAQASIVNTHIRSNALTSIAAYATFAFLIAVAGCLVVFAPTGRETAATVAAAALFAVAVVLGGIKAFRISLPGMDFLAGNTANILDSSANNKKRVTKKTPASLADRIDGNNKASGNNPAE